MHVFFQHFGIDESFTAKFIDLLFAHEFVLVKDHFFLLLLEFLGNVFDVGHPFRS